MKKLFVSLSILAAVSVFAGCQKDNKIDDPNKEGNENVEQKPEEKPEPVVLAGTSWTGVDSYGVKSLLTFEDETNCFVVEGFGDAWEWNSILDGTYTFDQEKNEGVLFEEFPFKYSDGKITVTGDITLQMEKTEFVERQEPEPQTGLAHTSWIYYVPEDSDGGKMAITFLDETSCFIVNGDKEGWWWSEDDGFMVGEYSFDSEENLGVAFGFYSLQLVDGMLALYGGMFMMEPTEFFTMPE